MTTHVFDDGKQALTHGLEMDEPRVGLPQLMAGLDMLDRQPERTDRARRLADQLQALARDEGRVISSDHALTVALQILETSEVPIPQGPSKLEVSDTLAPWFSADCPPDLLPGVLGIPGAAPGDYPILLVAGFISVLLLSGFALTSLLHTLIPFILSGVVIGAFGLVCLLEWKGKLRAKNKKNDQPSPLDTLKKRLRQHTSSSLRHWREVLCLSPHRLWHIGITQVLEERAQRVTK